MSSAANQHIFVRNTPVSEAASGVTSIFQALGLDTRRSNLAEAEAYFQGRDPDCHLNHILELADVDYVVMTNDPLDDREAVVWLKGDAADSRFCAALRLDRIVKESDTRWSKAEDLRRFLDEWSARMKPLYMAISLASLQPLMDESRRRQRILAVILSCCRDLDVPLTLMLGDLCRMFPGNKFLVTCLSLENQHELSVLARKFSNLTPFGCCWFVNNPSMVLIITEQRIEMLGLTFIAQYSDSRVPEQLIYKWRNARRVVGVAYANSAARLAAIGRELSTVEVMRDADLLFRDNFNALCTQTAQH
jgi:hypothetical protein